MGKKTDKILGSISPLYGAISGRGAFGGLQQVSPVGMAIAAQKKKKKKKTPAQGMRKGGSVKVRRGDGCCKRGHTKGKFK